MSFKDDRKAFDEAYARRSANSWRQQKDTPGYRICDWSDRVLIVDSDPAYGKEIGSLLESIEIQDSFLPGGEREVYESIAGVYQGKKVSVLHTGITPYSYGASYMDFTLERLRGLSTKQIVVVGEASGIQQETRVGDFLLPLSVIRDDDIHRAYSPPDLPATADAELAREILQQAERRKLDDRFHTGIGWSCGNGAGVYEPALQERLERYQAARVLGNCLGAAAAYLLGSMLGHQVASCWLVADSLYEPISWKGLFPRMSWETGWSTLIEMALAALTAV